MAKDIVIERVRPEDWRVMRDIRLLALKSNPEAFQTTYESAVKLDDSEWKARAQKFSHGCESACFLAIEGDEPFAIITGVTAPSGRMEMIQMWVHPSKRGTGLSRKMVETLKTWVSETGASQLYAWVFETNTIARSLYEKCGFRSTGHVEVLPGAPEVRDIEITADL